MKDGENRISFDSLVTAINDVHNALSTQISKAVNISLTIRNWIIGCYIAEYELNGSDRADYGDDLFSQLASRLATLHLKSCAQRQLYNYLQFYRVYPQIKSALPSQVDKLLPLDSQLDKILRSVTAKFNEEASKGCLQEEEFSPNHELQIDSNRLLSYLSYTHIEQLIKIDDPLKRAFYEFECIRGNWSVRELKRQIASLYYERSALSKDKRRLSELANAAADQNEPALAIRDPYVFEFLGIKPSEVMVESRLEDALTDKLQDFLLELGHGFCFEARQKRILIGDTYGFVDLVFYHRILKCHVLIDLKLEEFSHENIGQLNTYVSWYRRNMMAEDDNPPVGILLCTNKDHALVEYALAGMDNQLFVSKYQLALPDKEAMERFLEREIAASELDDDDSKTGRLVREIRKRYETTEIHGSARKRELNYPSV